VGFLIFILELDLSWTSWGNISKKVRWGEYRKGRIYIGAGVFTGCDYPAFSIHNMVFSQYLQQYFLFC
jgi:hypothetical protein